MEVVEVRPIATDAISTTATAAQVGMGVLLARFVQLRDIRSRPHPCSPTIYALFMARPRDDPLTAMAWSELHSVYLTGLLVAARSSLCVPIYQHKRIFGSCVSIEVVNVGTTDAN